MVLQADYFLTNWLYYKAWLYTKINSKGIAINSFDSPTPISDTDTDVENSFLHGKSIKWYKREGSLIK